MCQDAPCESGFHAIVAAGEASSNPPAVTRVTQLTNTVTPQLKHNAIKPAFNPLYGSRPVNVKSAAMLMPIASPANTPVVVTRFENRPSATPGNNCATPAYPRS